MFYHFIWIFSPLCLITHLTSFFAISFGPISNLIGTPFNSQWLNFHPGVWMPFESIWTLTLLFFISLKISYADCYIYSYFSLKGIGMITTWTFATLGGRTNPLSSPWYIVITPMDLVVRPQLVCHTCFFSFF